MNVIPTFHLDSCWNLDLDKFKRLEDKTYILALDSKTDIRKAREVLGKDVCILGDVPCELMDIWYTGGGKRVCDKTSGRYRTLGLYDRNRMRYPVRCKTGKVCLPE